MALFPGTPGADDYDGTEDPDTISGLAGNDELRGAGGDDLIDGGDDDDLIDGGSGADTMTGGTGNDIFFIDNFGDRPIETAAGGSDLVYTSVAYGLADEIERLAVNGFSTTFAINLTGNALDNEIWGNDGVNILDGAGGADILHGFGGNDVYMVDNSGDVVVEHSGGGVDLVYTDVGYTLRDEIERLAVNGFTTTFAIDLTGNALANEIWGNDGINVIDGGAGADILHGFGGGDYYIVDDLQDVIVEQGGGGLDTVYTLLSGYRLTDHVERLAVNGFGTSGNIDLTGNDLDNELWGNAGRNVLDGGIGADIMRGHGGDDVYIVDNAGDQVVEYALGWTFGGGNDLIYTSVDYTLGPNIERMGVNGFTTTYAINLTGNESANELWGNDGVNFIDGLIGADILHGNGGADRFLFTTTPGNGNVDQIVDFQPGVDKIVLDDSVFTGLTPGDLPEGAFRVFRPGDQLVGGGPAQDADDRIIYSLTSGALFFDPDGTGPANLVQFATLQPGLNLTVSDFIVI